VRLAGDGVIDRDAVRAAERGKRYMIDPSLPLVEISRLVALYDAAYNGAPGMELPFFNYGFISDDSDPWKEMREGFTYLRQTYDRWAGRAVRDVHRANHRLILGTPRQVAEEVLDYHRMFGDLRRRHGDRRRALMWEPRGHLVMFGAVVGTPADPAADLGLVFMDGGGTVQMCVHGTIGAVTALVETGRLKAPRDGVLTIDTPV